MYTFQGGESLPGKGTIRDHREVNVAGMRI
jgi:hypothetical protein